MRNRLLVNMLMLLPLVFSSCVSGEIANSKDVNQSQIFTKYYITVDAESESALFEAVFRFGGPKGTSLILTEPAKISFNRQKLKGDEKMFTGYHYTLKSFPSESNTYVVKYHDYEGNEFINNFVLMPIGIPNFPGSFSKSSDINLEFSGNQIGTNEYVELSIIDTAGTEVLINSDVAGSQIIKIEREQLSSLKTGNCKFRISRVYITESIKSPEIGGVFDGRYKSIHYTSLLTN